MITADDLADLYAGNGENGNGTIVVGDKVFDFNGLGGTFNTVASGGATGFGGGSGTVAATLRR